MFALMLLACQTAACTPATSVGLTIHHIPTLEQCKTIGLSAAYAFKAEIPAGGFQAACILEADPNRRST